MMNDDGIIDSHSNLILSKLGIDLMIPDDFFIPREQFLDISLYNEIKILIPELKKTKVLSSSSLTSLQKNAPKEQKWPLLNLVRQILNAYRYEMEPVRKSDGYTKEGVKKYRRYFQIRKMKPAIQLFKEEQLV
jgi:hypothetical protein